VRLDAAGPLLIGLALVVAAAVGIAFGWERRTVRIVLAVVSTLAVMGTSALELNRLTEAYPTWSALVGAKPATDTMDRPGPATETSPAPAPAGAPRPAGGAGRIVELTIAGPASGMSMPAYVYLPSAYATGRGRFPVIEATHGFPGSPKTWLTRLDVVRHLDREIAAGRMAPTVVVFASQTPSALVDTECLDLTRGPKAETYLTRDVPAAIAANFRVRTDRAGWGLIGYSAGGFCSTDLILRHPGQYAAAASLSGYAGPGIKVGDASEKTLNNSLWRLQHLTRPPIGLYLAWANDDKHTKADGLRMAQLATAPIAVTTAIVAHGGHSDAVWQTMEGPAFDWLSSWLARPVLSGRARPVLSGRARPVLSGPAQSAFSRRARPVLSGPAQPAPSGRAQPAPSGRARPVAR
jgi:enterochelin esterase-like enzyme